MVARNQEPVACMWCGSTRLTLIGSAATRSGAADGEVINAYQCECGMAFTTTELAHQNERRPEEHGAIDLLTFGGHADV